MHSRRGVGLAVLHRFSVAGASFLRASPPELVGAPRRRLPAGACKRASCSSVHPLLRLFETRPLALGISTCGISTGHQ